MASPTILDAERSPRMAKKWKPGGQRGKLHDEIHVPRGEKIPAGKLEAATHSKDPEIRRDAIRAETMKKWKHGGSKSRIYAGKKD